jgi:hypothetical protein
MKTFEQFFGEAHASQRDIKGSERFLSGAHGTINVSSTRRSKEEKDRAQRLSNLPAGTGTSASAAQRDIQRQREAQQTVQTTEQERKDKLTKAAEILAARKQDPEQKAKREKAEKARARSAQRATRKAQNS